MKTLDALIKTNSSLTAVIDGSPKTMSSAHPLFESALDALSVADIDLLDELFDTANHIKKQFSASSPSDNIEIIGDSIYYKGEIIHNYVVDKIMEFIRLSLPFAPLVKFLDKLLQNPSKRAIDELYRFLEHRFLPICEDGDFLAYKSVRQDYTDHHTGRFSNVIGSVLEMPRNKVCDNANNGCSDGFHAGSFEYASTFGGAGSRMVIVKINPADVVSVPNDCDCQKLRTCRYEVYQDYDKTYKEPLFREEKKQSYHNVRDSKGRFMKKI